jgi:hypothetical protein
MFHKLSLDPSFFSDPEHTIRIAGVFVGLREGVAPCSADQNLLRRGKSETNRYQPTGTESTPVGARKLGLHQLWAHAVAITPPSKHITS